MDNIELKSIEGYPVIIRFKTDNDDIGIDDTNKYWRLSSYNKV